MKFAEQFSRIADRARMLARHPHARQAAVLAKAAYDWAKEPLIVIAIALVSTTAVARPFYVPSGSMEPTVQIGDALLATKFAYGYSRYSMPFGVGPDAKHRLFERLPERGDIVVFQLPRDPSQTYVKRVLGLPGDTIQMLEGRLYINGKELPLKEAGAGKVENADGSEAEVPRFVETLPNGRTHLIFKYRWNGPLDNTNVYVVPAHHVFMIGDNRDNSLDSRVPADEGGVGFVPVENLVARAEFVVGSVDFLNAQTILGWPAQLRMSRFFASLR